ncbi:MAG: NUDIX domain-containing protein [Candidatus Ancillula sp.]|jgi:8-oxo-dGTP diphosphatase|nr:NUDIX domain-containing protein [Candidatus Ancillula sp.]
MKKIECAGAIVHRINEETGVVEVLLVHRPRYKDWSFPKGKLEKKELAEIAACREVCEETGVAIVLDKPLGQVSYTVPGLRDLLHMRKNIRYYIAHELPKSSLIFKMRSPVKAASKKEIDDVRWVSTDDALNMLTYRDDRRLIEMFRSTTEFADSRVVLEFAPAKSVKKSKWHGKKKDLPLTHKGKAQASKLSELLSSFGIENLIVFSSKRFHHQTFEPYASETGIKIKHFKNKEDPHYKKLISKPKVRVALLKK